MTAESRSVCDREFAEAIISAALDEADGDEADAIEYLEALVATFGFATAISRARLTSRRATRP
jgi:hypothetical protein